MPNKSIDLLLLLPKILTRAAEWVEMQEREVLATGRPLTPIEMQMAGQVGVSRPANVRVKFVSAMPFPEDVGLGTAAMQTGLLTSQTAGITFGHGIFIRQGHLSNRLVSHELRHVHQYESAGSIHAFLRDYLHQIATLGYDAAPLEIDARRWERDAP